MNWGANREADQRLTSLWHQGVSTARIAAAMGISKNAVVGRAHRLGLHRDSPLKTPLTPAQRAAKPRNKVRGRNTLEVLEQISALTKAAITDCAPPEVVEPEPVVEAPQLVVEAAKPPPAAEPAPLPSGQGCQWIEGDPRRKPIIFCCQPIHKGAWCLRHYRAAYSPMPARRMAA